MSARMYSVSLWPARSLASVFGLGSKFENFFKVRRLALHSGLERLPSLNCRHPAFKTPLTLISHANSFNSGNEGDKERGERRGERRGGETLSVKTDFLLCNAKSTLTPQVTAEPYG